MTDEPPKDLPQPGGPEAAAPVEAAKTVEVAHEAFAPSEPQPSADDNVPGAGAAAATPGDTPSEPAPSNPTTSVVAEAAAPPTPGDTPTADDNAILPASLDDNALRDAVGAPPARPSRRKRRDGDDDSSAGRPGSRRLAVIGALVLLAALAIAALVLLGRANASRYVIACTTDQVSAEQGRSFPPWGTRPLIGPEWRPITLPASAECKPRETDDRGQLESWFLDLLVDRASTTLTARDLLDSIQPGKTSPLDMVDAQLRQALLLSRAPEHRDQRKEVERLLGDVQYWRASLRLRDAAAALADAARQFDAAAAQRPRHVTDAAEWAAFLRATLDSLHAGPLGASATGMSSATAAATGESAANAAASHDDAPISDRPIAPAGTALPAEPDAAATTDHGERAAPPDAGLPTGGVLL